MPAEAIGRRGVFVEPQTGGRRGAGYCDLDGATAQRDGHMLDVNLEAEASGGWRWWVAMAVDAPTATLRLGGINERLDPTYAGDAKSGVVVGRVELHETTRFVPHERSLW